MRRHYSTEQFDVFKQEAAEDFLGQIRWKTQHALQQMLEADSEQQMADYLGAVGRVVALLTDEPVSAQTVSRLTRTLDREVEKFHHATLADDWAYLLLDGVWMKVRRAFGPQRVLLLVAYGVRANGQRQLLAFTRARAESQTSWEGFLWDLHQRGLAGRHLKLVLSDGCAGLAAAIETVYPRAQHQRCWVHKMRNLHDGVRRRDFVFIGRLITQRWSNDYSATCPSCSPFSTSRNTCGASCVPLTP